MSWWNPAERRRHRTFFIQPLICRTPRTFIDFKMKQHNNTTQHHYHIITFGCQMNKNDSERLESVLQRMGMKAVEECEKADVILMNSCSVRKSAEDRIFGLNRNFLKLKKKNPNLIIGVTGCMPGRDIEGKMNKQLKAVDLYFPIKDIVHLPKWLSELNPNLEIIKEPPEDYLNIKPVYHKKFQAYVPIQTGCNHFCTYCVVPFSRGTEQNRSVKNILTELCELAENGCLEVELLGQIINHYIAPDPKSFSKKNPYKKNDLAKLLWEVNQIDGIKRLHWTSAHPIYMDDEVIDALTILPKQVNYLHLPVQSGSNEILKKMNRRHDRNFYIDIVKKIRKKKPDMAIGTDIIVGFCGESEKMFEDTIDLYKQCDFDISYNAQFSPRNGTVAFKMFKDDVSKKEKKRRWEKLQSLMEEITFHRNQVYKDKKVDVLIEKCDNGWCKGNSPEMKRIHLQGDESLVGRIIPVFIEKADEWVLWGRLVT